MKTFLFDIPAPPSHNPEYAAYLRTETWERKRDAVFERDNGVCQGCLEESIEHVHHMTYANLYDELLFQLIGLCANCHNKVHWIKKANREVRDDLDY